MTGLGHGLRPDRRAMVGADAGTSVPGISVVIPTYQRAHVIGEAIASVLRQTHSHFELLVVDDGSTDETAAVVSSFKDERLKLVSIDHGGRCARETRELRARGGASVVFLDSDDQAEPNWLEKLYLAFDNPAVAVVCCGAQLPPTGHNSRSTRRKSSCRVGLARLIQTGSDSLERALLW